MDGIQWTARDVLDRDLRGWHSPDALGWLRSERLGRPGFRPACRPHKGPTPDIGGHPISRSTCGGGRVGACGGGSPLLAQQRGAWDGARGSRSCRDLPVLQALPATSASGAWDCIRHGDPNGIRSGAGFRSTDGLGAVRRQLVLDHRLRHRICHGRSRRRFAHRDPDIGHYLWSL